MSEIRPRRLRTTPAMRKLAREVHVHPSQLVQPIFVGESRQAIESMPGVRRHTIDEMHSIAVRAARGGLGGIMLFGIPAPEDKDPEGSQAWAEDGILQRAIREVRNAVGDDTVIMADTCLDEFTSHGHCGVLNEHGKIDNDATLELYAKVAVAQANAGVHVVAPSGMMDGQVHAIRQALDSNGHQDVSVLAYAAKYASAFYGPFRDAVNSSLEGDRRSYQQDPSNRREAIREATMDIREGADMVMVKPAAYYLDVLSDIAKMSQVPVAAYQVSGEYAIIELAASKGLVNRMEMAEETVTSILRAGADIVLTYWALELASWLR